MYTCKALVSFLWLTRLLLCVEAIRPRNAAAIRTRGGSRLTSTKLYHPRILKKDKEEDQDKLDDNNNKDVEQEVNDDDGVDEDRAAKTNQPTTVPPVDPPAIAPGEKTEDDEEFDDNTASSTLQQKIENACRSASRGSPIETSNHFTVTYEYQLFTSSNEPPYSGFAVDSAVQEYLTDQYIMKHCDAFLPENGSTRLLQETFAAGDVLGVKRGDDTTVTLNEECEAAPEDSTISCFRLQGSNTIFLDENFVQSDSSSDAVLNDVTSAFSSGDIATRAKRFEPDIVQVDFVQEIDDRGTGSSNGDDGGMKPAGKVFLSFFILLLFAMMGYVGYKYGKPKYESWNENRLRTRQQRDRVALNDSFSDLRRKKEGDGFDEIVIAETLESCSTDGGGGGPGTEMILADLQDVSAESPVEFQAPSKKQELYTPSTLPDVEERSRPHDESNVDWSYSFNDVSFSDIQVVVEDDEDDSSLHYGINKIHRKASRSYVAPDTVDL